MPVSWLNKYGYNSAPSTSSQPAPTTQPSSQPSWTTKYGNIAKSTPAPAVSPSFQNATNIKNNIVSPAIANATNIKKMQGSIVPNAPTQPNFGQQVGNIFGQIGNVAKGVAKQVIDFLPKAPEYAKQAAKNPLETAAGAGEASLKTFGSLAGLVEHGIASVAGVSVPERWDVSKQTNAIKTLNDQILQTQGVDKQKAFETGRFLGSFLPYALAGEVAGASIGAKILLPTAEKFLPAAVKFIPAINNAIGFLGIGQIEHDAQNGSRIDQFKNDLIMLSLFEVGGGVLKGVSKGTKSLITNTLSDIKGKPKIDFETESPKIQLIKDAIKEDTGNSLQTIVADNITTGKPVQVQKDGAIINADGTQKANTQTQVPEEIPQAKTSQTQSFQSTKIGPDQALQTPTGEGQTKVSKLGLRVEQTAIEKKLTSELTDLPEYKQLNMKEQASKASELINSDPEKAMRIALGHELPPEGLLKESVFKAVENSITTPEMARKLASSPLVSEGSALGQRIKALDVKTSESPVEAIKQVINARAKTIEDRLGRSTDKATEAVVKEIKSKIKAPSKYDWNAFVESIKC